MDVPFPIAGRTPGVAVSSQCPVSVSPAAYAFDSVPSRTKNRGREEWRLLKPKASSFRAECSGDPESSLYSSRTFWIIRYAYPSGRTLGVQRATRFCPAFAGMTVLLNI